MTFEEVISTIENKRRFGKACGRDVTMEFLDALNHPESEMHVIHIAGTNGKGSVAAFVSSILQAASFSYKEDERFKVGLFTSPHLIDFTERISIDGVQISKDEATRIGEMLLGMDLKLEPTMFDYCLAMALVYFKEQGVKYVVLETGLGGSKDSTSGLSVVPDVCAITSIGLEHTAILGNTLEEIAMEKAGILKAGTKCVIGDMDSAARKVITDCCEALDVEYSVVDELATNVELGLFGKYQRKNAAVAVEIINRLEIEIDANTLAQGLKDARWPGRMDIVSKDPFVMLDGAHNPAGVRALRESLVEEYPGSKFTFIMAVMADKDYQEMINIISDVSERVYALSIDSDRALQAKTLAEDLKAAGLTSKAFDCFEIALDEAKSHEEKIVVLGSLYFIGDVLKLFRS